MPFAVRSLRTALAGVCLLTVSACTGSSGASVVTFPPAHRKTAPDLSGPTLVKGTPFSLAAEKGHVVVINYWASWCDPCRDEMAALGQAATDFQPKGVAFIGVSFHGDSASDATAFLTGHDVPYPSLSDVDSKTVLQFRGKVAIAAPPLTMVIDKQGRIADVINGQVLYSQLRDLVTAAMNEPA